MKISASLIALTLALTTSLLPVTSMAKPAHRAKAQPTAKPAKPAKSAKSAKSEMPANAVVATGTSETPGVPSPPDVYAHAYILIDYTTGKVLAQHEADTRMEPASLTKLMTCYGVFKALKTGTLKLQDMVTISEHAWRAEGSRTFVQVGSQIPAEVLIKGMIVQSGNDATIALAEKVGGTEPAFVQMMNQYAKQLGMNNTHFDDSTGLPSPTHYTTARDLSILAAALVREFPEYYPWFSIREFVWNNIKQDNRNGLLERDPTVDGLKTGHTDTAGYCLVTSAKRDDMRLITVVLNSPNIKGREDASAALLNYGYTFYQTLTVKQKGTVLLKPRVYKGSQEYFPIGTATDVTLVVPRSQAGNITTTATAQRRLIAPISSATPVGEMQVVIDGKPIKSVPLYPLADIPAGGIWNRMSDSLLLMFQKSN
jgi:D-alanyl-D-alanine carboxypeptidase (penicillin-binding protein 5/6)